MVATPEIQHRIDALRTEIEDTIALYGRLARLNYWGAAGLMALTLASSALAALGGFLGFPSQLVGSVALLPGVIALIATTFNLQGRANWHYRKKDALYGLRRKLLFELPENPAAQDIAAVAEEWTQLNERMNVLWESDLSLSWAAFARRGEQAGR